LLHRKTLQQGRLITESAAQMSSDDVSSLPGLYVCMLHVKILSWFVCVVCCLNIV